MWHVQLKSTSKRAGDTRTIEISNKPAGYYPKWRGEGYQCGQARRLRTLWNGQYAVQSKANPAKHTSQPLCKNGAETMSASRVLSSENVGDQFLIIFSKAVHSSSSKFDSRKRCYWLESWKERGDIFFIAHWVRLCVFGHNIPSKTFALTPRAPP